MNSKKIVDGVVGKTNLKRLAGDRDGDGVMNAIDCQPNNRYKQGWVHDLAEKAKEKYNEYKAERETRRAEEAEVKHKERVAYQEARKTEAERIGRERAKIEANKRIETYKKPASGGFFDALTGTTSTQKSVGSNRKKVVTYKKVGKGKYKKVVSYKTTTPNRMANTQGATQNFLFGKTNVTGNEMNNMLGTGKSSSSMPLIGAKKKGENVLNIKL